MLSGLVSPDLKMAAGMFIHNRGGIRGKEAV